MVNPDTEINFSKHHGGGRYGAVFCSEVFFPFVNLMKKIGVILEFQRETLKVLH